MTFYVILETTMTLECSLDYFCDKFENFEGLFIKAEPLSDPQVGEYVDLFIKWTMLEDSEEKKDCEIDGIFKELHVYGRLSKYPSHLGKLHFILGNFDSCMDVLEDKDEKTQQDYLYLGLCYMLINRYKKASEVFSLGDQSQLSSVMFYFMGKMDKNTNRQFNDKSFLSSIFEELSLFVLQDKKLVLFSGDSEQGLLFRKCLAYFTGLIGSKSEICSLGKLDESDYQWTMNLCELNDIEI
eukprot:NODE_769_length_4386_cov_0.176155.p2 type:complete len:240 gc:universal NODE_769_length_4386_cov_0.176155:158-877(+)